MYNNKISQHAAQQSPSLLIGSERLRKKKQLLGFKTYEHGQSNVSNDFAFLENDC